MDDLFPNVVVIVLMYLTSTVFKKEGLVTFDAERVLCQWLKKVTFIAVWSALLRNWQIFGFTTAFLSYYLIA